MSSLLPIFLATAVLLYADVEVPSPAPRAEEAERAPEVAIEEDAVDALEVPRIAASSPLPRGYRVGSGFGYRPSRRDGSRTFHAGLDFAAPRGTPVYAVRAGIVETVAHDRRGAQFIGYGNAVVVHHPDADRWSFYAHLDEVFVEPGQLVEAGQLVGRVGNSSNRRFPGMGVHLHFEVRRPQPDGSSPFPGPYRRFNVDPARWLAESGVHLDRDDEDDEPLLVVREVAPASR